MFSARLCVEPDTQRCVLPKCLVIADKPGYVFDLEPLWTQMVLIHDFRDALFLVFIQIYLLCWGAVDHHAEARFHQLRTIAQSVEPLGVDASELRRLLVGEADYVSCLCRPYSSGSRIFGWLGVR